MSLNKTPRSNRIHIAIFGKRNVGKSSLINALTSQSISLVSEQAGTTTDPVFKSMELLPLGPVVIIDTAGIDDTGNLGKLRVEKTYDVINKTDIGVIVFEANQTDFTYEKNIIKEMKKRTKPYVLVASKIDIYQTTDYRSIFPKEEVIEVSSINKVNIELLKETIGKTVKVENEKFQIVGDLLNPGDIVVLVVPIDKAAPKGRLILPQQQTIRDCLESDAVAVVTKEHELTQTLNSLAKKPKLVITDSQVFLKVSADTPSDIMLTSFSILFARNKGDLTELVKGAAAIEKLEENDTILISEGCTHHRQSDDIGTVKIPRWLREHTGKSFNFKYSSGYSFPKDMSDVKLVIHCGACMLNKTEMMHRINTVKDMGIPIVNYGVLISYVQGIFDRALAPFPLAELMYQKEKAR